MLTTRKLILGLTLAALVCVATAAWAREFDDAALLRLYDQREALVTILAALRQS